MSCVKGDILESARMPDAIVPYVAPEAAIVGNVRERNPSVASCSQLRDAAAGIVNPVCEPPSNFRDVHHGTRTHPGNERRTRGTHRQRVAHDLAVPIARNRVHLRLFRDGHALNRNVVRRRPRMDEFARIGTTFHHTIAYRLALSRFRSVGRDNNRLIGNGGIIGVLRL